MICPNRKCGMASNAMDPGLCSLVACRWEHMDGTIEGWKCIWCGTVKFTVLRSGVRTDAGFFIVEDEKSYCHVV